MFNIHYDEAKKRVKQALNSLDLYFFEGDFDKVIKALEKEREYYTKNYVNAEKEINLGGGYCNEYIDGTRKKLVRFDKLSLAVADEYEEKVLYIWGERDFTQAEEEALIEKKTKQKLTEEEKELKEFERLQKKFGKV